MEGTIWVESQVGQGSTFNFTIGRGYRTATPFLHGQQPAHLSGKRMLIVDDNSTNRQILLAQTRAWGMISIPRRNGAEALELLHQVEGQPSILRSGYANARNGWADAAEEIRKIENSQGTPSQRVCS